MGFQLIITGSGMVLAGSLFVIVFKLRKRNVAFKFIAFGALSWIVAVMLKFAWAIPINRHAANLFNAYLIPEAAGPLFWIYVGLLTGIFECGLIYLAVRFTRLRDMSLDESYGFGYGFGCIEAALLGFSQLITFIAVATGQIPMISISWRVVPAPIIERVITIFLHLYTTLLIIYSIKQSKPLLFWLSFLYKSFVDTIAAWAQLSYGIETTSHLWTVEGLLFVTTIPSILGAFYFLKRKKPLPQIATDNTSPQRH